MKAPEMKPSVIRWKKPKQYISSNKTDEYSDERLWLFYKGYITFQTFKEELPVIRTYLKQVRVSEGFDIDVVPKAVGVGAILPDQCCCERWPEKYEAFMNLAKLAIGFYNKDNRKLFQRFEVEKVDKVNTRLDGLYHHYYITFTAVNVGRRGVRGDPVTFQTMVLVMGGYMFMDRLETIINLCRIKPEASSVEQD